MARSNRLRREDELDEEIRELELLAQAAADAGSFTAAVQARTKIAAIRTELSRLRDETAAEKEKDPIKRVRRLRRRASEDGSWVASANLLKQEQELVAEDQRKKDEAAKAARRAMSPEEFRTALVAKLKAMSPKLQALVRADMGWG